MMVSLVHQNHRSLGHLIEKLLHLLPRNNRPRRIIRVAHVNDPRPRSALRRHHRQIVPPLQRQRHSHRRSPHHPRIIQHRLKRGRRGHHIFIAAKKSRVRHPQNFRRAETKNDSLRRDFVQRRNILLQFSVDFIGIAHSLRLRTRHSRSHFRPRPIRILVKIQTNQANTFRRRRSALPDRTPSKSRRRASSRNSRPKPQRKFPPRKPKSSHQISSSRGGSFFSDPPAFRPRFTPSGQSTALPPSMQEVFLAI